MSVSPEGEDLRLPSILPGGEFVAVINDGGPDHGMFVYVSPRLGHGGDVRVHYILPWDHLEAIEYPPPPLIDPSNLRLLSSLEQDLFRRQLGSRDPLPGFPVPKRFNWQLRARVHKEDDPFPSPSELDFY